MQAVGYGKEAIDNIMKDKIRAILPEEAKEAFDDIVEQRVLGAGNHISMVGNMKGECGSGGQRLLSSKILRKWPIIL